jgi:O-Antigen ligase
LSEYYLMLLAGVLMGYAILGKGFAYIGFPPIFIGEIAFLSGGVMLLRSGCLLAALAALPSLLLAVTMIWVLLCTLPFVQEHGTDALRDSVVIMYGGFAFIVIAMVLEDGRRIKTILGYYNSFLSIFVPAILFIVAAGHFFGGYASGSPDSYFPAIDVRPSEAAVHLAGAAVFALVGLRKATPLWILLVLPTLLIAFSSNRGAMVAFVLPVAFAALVVGKARQLSAVLIGGLVIFAAVYAFEMTTGQGQTGPDSERQLSTRQIVANAQSIIGLSDQELEGTKKWRLDWWDIIIKDTVHGHNFWTGRGFGLNLADADGFQHRKDPNSPLLRSPHNVHMTILARAGVPGVVLWLLFLAAWFGMLANAMFAARRRQQPEWAGLFIFTISYVMAATINATFEVALEGPMQGIWFWCLVGFGIGSVMIYRYRTKYSPEIRWF